MKHYVYKLTIDNRDYYGYTSQRPKERLKQHLEMAESGKGFKLHAGLRKHNFKYDFEVVKSFPDEYSALCYEIQMIHVHHTQASGWNTSPGGEGITMNVIKEITIINNTEHIHLYPVMKEGKNGKKLSNIRSSRAKRHSTRKHRRQLYANRSSKTKRSGRNIYNRYR